MSNNSYFKLYTNCILVKGAYRSSIYDLQKREIRFIPNLLYKILQISKHKTINELKDYFDNQYNEGVDLYFNQLINEELGFYTDEPELFPELDTEFLYPGEVSNAIIEVHETNQIDYYSISSQLDNLGCRALEIRFQKNCNLNRLDDVIKAFSESNLRCIDISIHYIDEFNYENLNFLRIKHLRIKEILVHSANTFESYLKGPSIIRYVTEEISNNDCGRFSKNFFSVNISMFTEALKHNTCLNKKITIDVNGEIKNCPSIDISFGNVNNITLKQALNKNEIKELWHIKKDDIKICQDCEFRYACLDCRAYLNDSKNEYSHPKNCTYNPYQAKWKDEVGYIQVTKMTKKEIEAIKMINA